MLPWSTLGPMGVQQWLLSTSAKDATGKQYIVSVSGCKASLYGQQLSPHGLLPVSGDEKPKPLYTENATSRQSAPVQSCSHTMVNTSCRINGLAHNVHRFCNWHGGEESSRIF